MYNHISLLFDAGKLPASSSGSRSHSIDKWFSSDSSTKSAKKPVDFSAKPESTKTSAGQSGGIWGDFDCDSVPDAVLLTAADAVDQHTIKSEHFPGRGQKLSEDRDCLLYTSDAADE